MATDIGKLYAIIGADTSQFDKKMKGIGNRLSAVGKKLTMRLTLPLLALLELRSKRERILNTP